MIENKQNPVIDKTAAVRIATALGWKKIPEWLDLIKGVRIKGDCVIVSVKGGNEAARKLCNELLKGKNGNN